MKHVFAILITLTTLSLNLQASPRDTNYDERHMAKIEQAIAKECFLRGEFVQVDSTVEEVRVDQGITDYNYQTTFEHRDWIDQGVFDDYIVEVVSHYGDSYDHNDRNWGSYYVSSVVCTRL